ncbi:MAG TPA: ATP-binding protein [Burkholderiales bacterium]|nr:ATP-binding protein [Burkholderiales bacterium]
MPASEAPEEGRYKVPALLVLSEIASSLSTEATLDELVARYLSTMVRVAGALAGTVRLLTPDRRQLRLVSSVGLPPEMVERERLVPRDCGVCGESIDGLQATWSGEPRVCHGMNPGAFVPGCGEVIAVPLQRGGAVLGVYNLFLARGRTLSDDVRLLFGAISEHLGVALENAHLSRENARVTLVNERQLLANEVHDSVAQTLAYTRMRAAALREAQKNGDPARAERYLAEMEDAIEAAYGELRELIGRFRQPMDPRGLGVALRAAVDAFAARSDASVSFDAGAPEPDLSAEEEMHVFHIVQEALANVHKHARAKAVRVSLELAGGSCRVCVEDDGAGFASGAGDRYEHFGLAIMRERAKRLGGELRIESPPGGGARLCLTFPARGS